jgi:DNA-binding NarL/FixJ family response regulator
VGAPAKFVRRDHDCALRGGSEIRPLRGTVAITLSSSDLTGLQSAITTLVSPLDYDRVQDWRTACRVQVERLVSADSSAGMLPCPGEPLADYAQDLAPAMTDYLSYYYTLDTGLQQRRRELGLNVCHWSAVYDMRKLVKTEIYNDFSKARGLLDGIGMTMDFDEPHAIAALLFYHERQNSKPFGERGLAMLRVLFPAFKDGVDSCLRLAAQRLELGRLFDSMAGALSFFDGECRLVQQNRAATELLRTDSERETLALAVREVASAIAGHVRGTGRHREYRATPSMSRDVRTGAGHYRIVGSLLTSRFLAPKLLIAIAIDRVDHRHLSDQELQAGYGLTRREVEVARLLARRLGNAEIANALVMSRHTARHHTESVLQKLGLHSRLEVETALRH